ncbi:vWA domain-containing protein [Kaistella rhinocerotis]|uniref:vWA domain-containing protein n=1 Tax=Kaistella rhinocerotis TaxID=3026437 RepID=UPI002557B741|nr:vWA domain-containing protein [Kaistella sp. Ran72]
MKKTLVHNLIILDESGSMGSVYDATIDGFNNFLKNIKTSAEEFRDQEHKVSFVSFNANSIRYIAENVVTDAVPVLTRNNYRPAGGTPLFDAIGVAVNRLRYRTEYFPEMKVLVSIFTDGFENASTEFTAKSVSSLVLSLEKKGWTFTYIGTGHDITDASNYLKITNIMSFTKSKKGIDTMFDTELRKRREFYSNISLGRKDNSKDYFDGEK